MTQRPQITRLGPGRLAEAAEVLCEAFRDYPAMHFFIGRQGNEYEARLARLIGFFTKARELRGDPILALEKLGRIRAVAYVVVPGISPPAPLDEHRRNLWGELGETSRRRYEAHGEATAAFPWPQPHLHLAMLGVRRRDMGRGYARPLLEAVHELSRSDRDSRGIGLTTETRANLSLYEHFGYRRLGHARIGKLETWGFFRPDRVA